MKTTIVALAKNMVIGKNGDMPWGRGLPADLRHFKEVTSGQAVIMGSKTFQSILDSFGKPLPNRQNIVLSRSPLDIEDVTVVDSLEKAYTAVKPGREAFVIGGGNVYAQAMDNVDAINATEVQAEFDGDTFFPAIDPAVWQEVSREHHEPDEKNAYAYDFVTYKRK
jgi:dihydrofolate reductase